MERLLRDAAAPAEGLAAEVATLRAALSPPLAYLVGAGDAVGWAELVERCGLDSERAALLVNEEPNEAARDALWGLVTELNERRQLH